MQHGGLTADEVAEALKLEPHPEGGRYRRTLLTPDPGGGRGLCSAIYYLLGVGEASHWHRMDADEIWHHYAGGPLALSISENGCDVRSIRLGPDLAAGQTPQAIVPAGAWQCAESLGAWTLTGCTASPAFTFEGWELAPPDWRPQPRPGR